jgi:hypothetical protein
LICTQEKIMNRANLILHCGAHAVDRQQIYGVPTPAGTRTWFPIAHGTILDELQHVLTNNGLRVVSEAHGPTRDGARYFGLLWRSASWTPALSICLSIVACRKSLCGRCAAHSTQKSEREP